MDVLVEGVREALRLLVTGDAEVWAILRLSLLVSASGTAIALAVLLLLLIFVVNWTLTYLQQRTP